MTGMRSAFCALLLVLPARIHAECPPALEKASQLVLVTTPDMASVKASLRRFERAGPGQHWRQLGAPSPAVVGATGIAWGSDAVDAPANEPRKHEGDRRTPAGFFPLGRPFGTAASSLPFYMRLTPGQDICVDDPASPRYGQIVPRAEDPNVHGEDMGRVSLYRRGIVIDYPVDAGKRGGSCIFLHVWRASTKGTVGCVAMPEPAVATVQAWMKPGTLIGILPKRDADPFVSACLKNP